MPRKHISADAEGVKLCCSHNSYDDPPTSIMEIPEFCLCGN